ncbi:CocE/NonD family hydrolase [Nocardiopsis sp. CC223A]|uniref:CocE/NonD family hydrolase n=1 Tax=Nocardiopsis sp. CC223A TaxID=3044051 RepID=UPI00278C47BF|nr:CocE/NonD family hydrolase [Nocardiopsis sp. CC223A]
MPIIERVGPAAVPEDAVEAGIPMRDGVVLAADLYLADPERPGPAVLVRLPYDKDGAYCFMPRIARYLRDRGYHVVVQDVRGKYRSGGATEFAVHEVDDGYDTIAWIADRPWCDGSVVMWGDSYYGYTALAAAAGGHPALKAIAPRLTGSQLSTVLDFGDGTRDVEQTSRKLYFASHYVDADRYEWPPDWKRRPLKETFEDFFAGLGRRSANFDREFGGGPGFAPPPLEVLLAARPLPVLYTVGWFDNCAVWSWHDVRALAADERWARHLYLRVEPIDHENHHLDQAPVGPDDDHTASPGALDRLLPRYLDPAVEFFGAVLAGEPEPAPRVRYEVCHGPWRESGAWPPPDCSRLELHLAADPGPALSPEPGRPAVVEVVHDPRDPVPSPGDDPFSALSDRADLAEVGERPDVVRFTAAPVAGDVDLVGSAALVLALTARAGSTVHARLLDVEPGGAARLVARGQLRLTGDREGEPVVVDLQEVGYRLRAGHRLALDVTGGDFPDFTPEHPPGGDPWTDVPRGPGVRRISLGGSPSSRLLIGPRSAGDLRRRAGV